MPPMIMLIHTPAQPARPRPGKRLSFPKKNVSGTAYYHQGYLRFFSRRRQTVNSRFSITLFYSAFHDIVLNKMFNVIGLNVTLGMVSFLIRRSQWVVRCVKDGNTKMVAYGLQYADTNMKLLLMAAHHCSSCSQSCSSRHLATRIRLY